MPPKRASARASAVPTPTRISSRATRSRATPFADAPSPYTAQRGYLTNSYGDEERQPVPSGVADVNAARSFAAEMQAKVAQSQAQAQALEETRARQETQDGRAARASRALSESMMQSRSPSVQRTPEKSLDQSRIEEESEEIHSSGSRRSATSRSSRPRSVSVSRSALEEGETLPSGGLGPDQRQFDDYYEAGLELPSRLPGLPDVSELFGVDSQDLFWAAVFVAPLVPLVLLALAYGPLMTAQLVSALCTVKDMVHMLHLQTPSSSLPKLPSVHWPSWNAGVTHTITVAQATTTVTTTSTPQRWIGSDSKALAEINRMKTDMELMRDRMNLLEAQLSAPHKPNFFSPTLGAYISQRHTSPTRKQGTSIGTRAYFALFKEFVPPPPIAALKPWTENGECWCAAAADGGRLSLGVNLGRDVYPEHFVVEHIARSDALDISSAPRRLDLWAQLADGFEVADVPAAWRNGERCESPSPDARDARWLCLGMMAYDIELAQTAQSRSLDSYGVMPPFQIGRAVVRVLENHGQDYTCIYRVKLAGRVQERQRKTSA